MDFAAHWTFGRLKNEGLHAEVSELKREKELTHRELHELRKRLDEVEKEDEVGRLRARLADTEQKVEQLKVYYQQVQRVRTCRFADSERIRFREVWQELELQGRLSTKQLYTENEALRGVLLVVCQCFSACTYTAYSCR